MSLEFLKALLDYNFYDKYKAVITQDFIPRDYTDLYNTIINSHINSAVSLTVADLKALHKSNNPVMSNAKEQALEPLYEALNKSPVLDIKIQDKIIDNKVIQRIADEIAVKAFEIAAGKVTEITDIENLVDKFKKVKHKNQLKETTDKRKINIIELATTKSHNLKWTFNLPDLQDRLRGTGAGYFGVCAGRPDCFSDDTEILTNEGWKLFKNLNKNELVAQVSDNKEVSFIKPERYIENDYDGELIHFKHSMGRIDLLVTPDHTMVYDYKGLKQVKAKDFKTSGLWTILNSGIKLNGRTELTPFERFLIAFQADGSKEREGCTGKRGHVTVRFSFTKQRKINRLREILKEANLKFKEIELPSKLGYVNFYVQVKYSPSKTFNWVDISNISAQWGKAFIEELSYWGATRRSSTRFKYDTTLKINIDVVQAICSLSGIHTNYSIFKDDRKECFNDIHSISILTNRMGFSSRPIVKSTINYKGKVYCVTVPTGRIIIRRNNKVIVCGNCGKTSFYMSLTASPNGFLHQGAKVHIIGNEESTDRLKYRALSALTGLPESSIPQHAEQLQLEFAPILENLFIEDGFGQTIETLDSYCTNNQVDILIIDQLDKLGVTGKYGTNEEKLRAIYSKTRDIGKSHGCAVIGICQAGFTAHNKLHYGFECLEGSKTGKGAECDWCITIGMELQTGGIDNYYRMANIPKNKITGRKAPVQFVLDPEISRIHA